MNQSSEPSKRALIFKSQAKTWNSISRCDEFFVQYPKYPSRIDAFARDSWSSFTQIIASISGGAPFHPILARTEKVMEGFVWKTLWPQTDICVNSLGHKLQQCWCVLARATQYGIGARASRANERLETGKKIRNERILFLALNFEVKSCEKLKFWNGPHNKWEDNPLSMIKSPMSSSSFFVSCWSYLCNEG